MTATESTLSLLTIDSIDGQLMSVPPCSVLNLFTQSLCVCVCALGGILRIRLVIFIFHLVSTLLPTQAIFSISCLPAPSIEFFEFFEIVDQHSVSAWIASQSCHIRSSTNRAR